MNINKHKRNFYNNNISKHKRNFSDNIITKVCIYCKKKNWAIVFKTNKNYIIYYCPRCMKYSKKENDYEYVLNSPR